MEQPDKLPLSDAQKQELDRRLENYQQNLTFDSTWQEVKQRLGFS